MQTRTLRRIRGSSIVAVIVLAVGVAAFAMFRIDPWADRDTSPLPASFTLDLKNHLTVDPALVRYVQTGSISVDLTQVHALAAGPEGRIYVAGDHAVEMFSADGGPGRMIPVRGQPRCLAVGGAGHLHPGRIYVGVDGGVQLLSAAGSPVDTWDDLDKGALPTSIAVADHDIFVADAANRIVTRHSPEGKILGRIGQRDAERQMPGFIIPSPYFDLVVGLDGSSLHVVNPGARRIEVYTFDGQLQTFWGRAGSGLGDFFGCCNPAQLSLLPDGRFVTSEKGIPRIKVYDRDGDFQCVVAGPEQLGINETVLADPRLASGQYVCDVATDSQGRVLALDPRTRQVRVFQYREQSEGAGT